MRLRKDDDWQLSVALDLRPSESWMDNKRALLILCVEGLKALRLPERMDNRRALLILCVESRMNKRTTILQLNAALECVCTRRRLAAVEHMALTGS